jgi:hypothetical protein
MSRVTKHARQRWRGRTGVPIKAMLRAVDRVMAEGTPSTVFTGSFRRYLDRRTMTGTSARVYGDHVYIFGASDALITMYAVPPVFRELARRKAARALM